MPTLKSPLCETSSQRYAAGVEVFGMPHWRKPSLQGCPGTGREVQNLVLSGPVVTACLDHPPHCQPASNQERRSHSSIESSKAEGLFL